MVEVAPERKARVLLVGVPQGQPAAIALQFGAEFQTAFTFGPDSAAFRYRPISNVVG
jgi:hypothetical protein